MSGNPKNYALEPAAQAFVDATANPPYLYELSPEEGRKVVDGVQDAPIFKPEVDDEWIEIVGGPTGTVKVRLVKPVGASGPLPVIVYTHGAGWVFGDAHTHDRLVRDLVVGTGAAVVFPEYDHSPEAGYPTAVEQSYASAKWVFTDGAGKGLDSSRVAISGDSVGGNMAIALSLLAKERGDVTFVKQVLFYPVTNAAFDTPSYEEFAEGYWLRRDAMKWFWNQYTTDEATRATITVSPLRASLEQLAGLPDTLIINAEADVLRDEGEQFADRLRQAGVKATNARFGGIVHDFVMVNSLHDTEASKHAVMLAVAALKAALTSEQ
ncbi:esterase [Actinoplanes cyaneus]|uniref:Esterase n=1 Tax=Actinoplanes cyaneus TaxID=52696 RepID=A0A919ILR0_9ACTN|nr:alpha/beta hydrolase [Actinoplanes cyaneus]MCW2141714.1 Acetyl esterase/lipase [Actinoplanes cyaneus]GID68204.1 esterase [Actinoplanes cyaneus]